MQATAHYALIIAIVAGVVGALVVCLLTLAYGFTPQEGTPSAFRRRRSIARVGQGVATTSFGLAAIAAVAGLAAASLASAGVQHRVQTLQGRVDDLVSTLHRLDEATDRLQTLVPPPERPALLARDPASSPAVAAGGGAARRPVPRDAGWPSSAPVAVRDGDLARERVGRPEVVEEARAPSPSPLSPRLTEPIGSAVPREAAPGASGALPLAPELPPAPEERVEPIQPPAEPSDPTPISMAPASRVPAVVEVPRASRGPTPPPAAVRPPNIENPAGLRRRDQPEQPKRANRGDRGVRIERPERVDRTEVPERPERVERAETIRPERIERPEPLRPERVERPEIVRPERIERPDRIERPERQERVERVERRERHERGERRERGERIERPERRGGRD